MQNGQPLPMYTLLNLNEDGQAISVSNEYKDLNVQKDSSPLKQAFERKKAAGKELTAAMTFPGGTHDLWIRYWLAAGGIDPDTDIKVITVPPPQMVANMKVGTMDCFCVGEPWNEQLVNQNIGYTALTTGELWFKHPEKILGMRADFVDANPKATQAILMAVMEAQIWADKMENRQELAEIVGRRQWFNVPVGDINKRLLGDINYGNGREVKGTNLYMKFWGEGGDPPIPGRASTPGSSPRTSAGASSSRRSTSRPWSTRPTAPTSGARPPRRWASPARRPRFTRRRDLLRRREVRSRRADGLPQGAQDQADRLRMHGDQSAPRHCEERSDEAIQGDVEFCRSWIASRSLYSGLPKARPGCSQ
jgi:ABC-type nitrate/sulfonate/bicarbonate transport system substrate-binding protein